MFIKLTRLLPDGKNKEVLINTDNVLWIQPSSDASVVFKMSDGPELEVFAKLNRLQELLRGTDLA